MNYMKRKIVLILLCTYLVILTGCGSQGQPANLIAESSPVILDTNTLLVSTATQQFEPDTSESEVLTEEPADTSFDFTICFAGDINLDENWGTTRYLSAQPNGIYDCISEELVHFMQDADIMCHSMERHTPSAQILTGWKYCSSWASMR